MLGAVSIHTLATAIPIGPGGRTSAGALACAAIVLGGLVGYTWVATRFVGTRKGSAAGPGASRGVGSDPRHRAERDRAPEPEPLIDHLLRDLEMAQRDKTMIKAARRRIRASRRSPPPSP